MRFFKAFLSYYIYIYIIENTGRTPQRKGETSMELLERGEVYDLNHTPPEGEGRREGWGISEGFRIQRLHYVN